MRIFSALSKFFRLEQNAETRDKAELESRLARAYQAVFLIGKPDETERNLVFVDLAEQSGFYKITPPPCTDDERAFGEGKRALFAHIFAYLSLSEEEIRTLETAARQTASARMRVIDGYRDEQP